ncbi:hypothetical protein RchiOBHm_Chr4g0423431 [Rosa chinensis]|uniref:Uncharacterized protein n=1 Tax=Rosa chinensis TaxID=74649 RepID=A0A2P6QYT6_ROSCH|nr:hypothetical protein RchiOBHm_Chr4g0423431 [Rosa chinensis]
MAPFLCRNRSFFRLKVVHEIFFHLIYGLKEFTIVKLGLSSTRRRKAIFGIALRKAGELQDGVTLSDADDLSLTFEKVNKDVNGTRS